MLTDNQRGRRDGAGWLMINHMRFAYSVRACNTNNLRYEHKYIFPLFSTLQVGSMLINRVANTDMTWHQEVTNAAPRVSPIIDLTLDDSSVIRAIDNLNFIQMKREYTGNGNESKPQALVG